LRQPARAGFCSGFFVARTRAREACFLEDHKESRTMLFETGEGGKSLKPPAPRRTNLRL
jgi:hypothetical protein